MGPHKQQLERSHVEDIASEVCMGPNKQKLDRSHIEDIASEVWMCPVKHDITFTTQREHKHDANNATAFN